MSRATILMVLVLVLSLTSVSSHVMAFTLRFGPVSVADDATTIHDSADADLPTPRLFNVAVGVDGMTFGPMTMPHEETVTVPAIRVRGSTNSRVADAPSTPHHQRLTSSRRLSGVEIMMLQHAKQIAVR